MSEENVEVVRQAWKAFNEHGIEAAVEYYAEDCVVEALPEAPDRETRAGREGVRERNRVFNEAFGDLDWEPVEFIDAADDIVVAVIALHGRGQGSGTPIDAPIAFVYGLRDGMLVRDRPFRSKDQALEAAGQRE
jgi:ketosteroid isomerase-like protein